MRVFERFGDKSATIADLTPTVLYSFAAPSTPNELVEDVRLPDLLILPAAVNHTQNGGCPS